MSPNSFEGGQNNYNRASQSVDKKDKPLVSIDALRLLRDSLHDKPPRYKDLPDQIGLEDNYLNFVSSLTKLSGYDDSFSIYDLNENIREVGIEKKAEIGASIVVNHKNEMSLGPLVLGELHSVPTLSILEEKWVGLANKSGKLLRSDKMAAFLHTHPYDQTFSSADIQSMKIENFTQLYVTSFKKDIYLLQATVESARLSEEDIDKIVAEYDLKGIEILKNYPDSDVVSAKLHNLLIETAKTLKLGYYSNRESKKSTILNIEK